MSAATWLRSRMGCAGPPRDARRSRLLRSLPTQHEPGTRDPACVDLTALLRRLGVPGAGIGLPGWAEPGRAREVACWGAALALLGLPPHHEAAAIIAGEAAAFNLAVALFDTVVDEVPGHLPVLATALSPPRLANRLAGGRGLCLPAEIHEPTLALIVRLFDHTLGSLSVRLGEALAARDELARLLQLMYESETGGSDTPFLAKTLPIVFIGRLVLPEDDPTNLEFYAALAQFIASWDDAQDLFSDWLRGKTNRYLWRRRLSPLLPRATGRLVGVRRLILARRSRSAQDADLTRALRRVLAVATRRGDVGGTARFARRLIGGAS